MVTEKGNLCLYLLNKPSPWQITQLSCSKVELDGTGRTVKIRVVQYCLYKLIASGCWSDSELMCSTSRFVETDMVCMSTVSTNTSLSLSPISAQWPYHQNISQRKVIATYLETRIRYQICIDKLNSLSIDVDSILQSLSSVTLVSKINFQK